MSNKPVIATSDGSAHSLRVVPHAARIAAAMGSDLTVLRIVEDLDLDGSAGESRDAAMERARGHLEGELQHELQREGLKGDAMVDITAQAESVTAAILRKAAGASLLAMNSRGKGMIASLLHGSVALGVLGKAELPVMLTGPEILGPPAQGNSYRLLITTDCPPDSNDVIRALAPLL